MSSDYDVVIVGGGMVGSLLAAALASESTQLATEKARRQLKPLRVCVLEERLPPAFEPGSNPDYDLRVSALSIASEQMLKNVGAWDAIIKRRACPYSRLGVWDGEQHGQTDFDASDIGASHLGHIVENRVIQLAVLDRLQALPNVELLSPVRLQQFQVVSNQVQLKLSDGSACTSALLVGADGANSFVRNKAGIEINKKKYPQHALVATIETANAQQDITWQRFVPTGPQAFLPLCGNQGSIVWYHTAEEVARLLELDDDAFVQELQAAFPEQLGPVRRVCDRGSFPIAKAHAEDYVSDRVALVGDAAHTVHPLAGQGVNLGLLDAGCLVDVVIQTMLKGRDIGERSTLRRYQRWRYGENQLMISALDGLYELFKPQPALVQRTRSMSLDLVNKVHPVKMHLMQRAMGTIGDLPSLAKPNLSPVE